MWKKLVAIVDRDEMTRILAWFVTSAVLQGVTLALMIPFLRSLLGDRADLAWWLAAVVTAGVATFVVDTVASLRSYRVSVYEVCDTTIGRLAEHVLRLPLGWFDAGRESSVANATSREINTLSHLASLVIPNLCNAFIVPLVMIVATACVDWRLAAVMAATIVPLYLIWRAMAPAARRASRLESDAATAASGRLIEFARLQPVLRATGTTEAGWEPLRAALAAEASATLAGLRIKGRPARGFLLVANLAFAVVLALGLSFVAGHDLDAVAYLALMAVTARMLLPLTQASLYATEVDNAGVALDVMLDILGTAPLPEVDAAAAGDPDGTDIVLDRVSFAYEPGRPVLDGVSLTAPQGTVTALVGPSGVGKSTVLRLAARFWDVDSGTVTIGGVDVRNLPSTRIMSMISMVFQDVYLFDTTIRENLRIARPDATDADLEEAARRARLDRVVAALPDGWDTRVGPGGLALSGGERQRVAIARAFVKDAPILLLDEITSALDGENESAIAEVVSDLARGRTVLVVAHRLSTIRGADRVVVLDAHPGGARVAQCGSPADLAASPGLFAEFAAASVASARWRLGS